MTNLEAYKEIIKEYVKETGELTCAVAKLRDFPLKNCNYIACSDCKQFMIDWLSEEHIEPIELTQFEYDLLLNCKEAIEEDGKDDDVIKEWWIIKGMKEKGHFKNVEIDMTFKEVLENCVVKDDGN